MRTELLAPATKKIGAVRGANVKLPAMNTTPVMLHEVATALRHSTALDADADGESDIDSEGESEGEGESEEQGEGEDEGEGESEGDGDGEEESESVDDVDAVGLCVGVVVGDVVSALHRTLVQCSYLRQRISRVAGGKQLE
jgi:hypothetical protein